MTAQKWSDDHSQREIQACDLDKGDVSICAFGANSNISAAMRSLITRRLSVIAGSPNRGGPDLDLYRARAYTLGLKNRKP